MSRWNTYFVEAPYLGFSWRAKSEREGLALAKSLFATQDYCTITLNRAIHEIGKEDTYQVLERFILDR